MPALVADCLVFFKQHASAVIRHPIDLSCINDGLVRQLAALFAVEELDDIVDKKDKVCALEILLCNLVLICASLGRC